MVEEVLAGLNGNRELTIRNIRVPEIAPTNIDAQRRPLEAAAQQFARVVPETVEGREPEAMHQLMARALDNILQEIHRIQHAARSEKSQELPVWPMIILRTPKGWTGPKVVEGKPIEDTWRAHQVPLTDFKKFPAHVKMLEDWMKSYKPQELFDKNGKFRSELAELAPTGNRRMGANLHANGRAHQSC